MFLGPVEGHIHTLIANENFNSNCKRNYYRPQKKFAKVMFLHLSVSHSVHRGRGGLHPGGQTPSPSDTTGYGQRAGGRHPTGMHSCFTYSFLPADKVTSTFVNCASFLDT